MQIAKLPCEIEAQQILRFHSDVARLAKSGVHSYFIGKDSYLNDPMDFIPERGETFAEFTTRTNILRQKDKDLLQLSK